MSNLKNAKEAAADLEKSLQNRIAELNKVLETRDHEIIVIGKKIMKVRIRESWFRRIIKDPSKWSSFTE